MTSRPTIVAVNETLLVSVLAGAEQEQWTLATIRRDWGWLVSIADRDGNNWAAQGPDLFGALQRLRRHLDPLGVRIGVNGARRDAWAAGMRRDLGSGRIVYVLTGSRPAAVDTLGPAALAAVGTVEEQVAQFSRWLLARRSPA
jgi:hypothetical protein